MPKEIRNLTGKPVCVLNTQLQGIWLMPDDMEEPATQHLEKPAATVEAYDGTQPCDGSLHNFRVQQYLIGSETLNARLPEPKTGRLLLVSRKVAELAPERTDLVFLGEAVTDCGGNHEAYVELLSLHPKL